jgi:hypothetical protein
MATYIRCPECSFCIGKYADFVDRAKQAIYNDAIFRSNSKYAEYDPEKMVFNPQIVPSLEIVWNALNIKNRCCRQHLLSKTEFDKMYK